MDALFGLPRKKSAGVSFRNPLHADLVFCDQFSVDQFVAESNTKKTTPTVSKLIIVIIYSGFLFTDNYNSGMQ